MLLKSLSLYHKKHSNFNHRAIAEVPISVAVALLMLLCASSVLLYSSGNGNLYPRAFKQIVFSGIAIVAFLLVISINIKNIQRFSYAILAASFLSLVAIIPFGKHIMGASRWINLGFFMVQPSEFAKLAVVLALANFFRSIQAKNINKIRTVAGAFAIISPLLLLIAAQPDLATSIVVLGIFVVMIFTIGIPYRFFVAAGAGVLVLAPIAWLKLLKDYQKNRVITFLFPESDPLGAGYNVIQSKIAIGSGGLLGKGFLHGTQSRLSFLPEHHTDFIFTIVGEEFGFLGCVTIIAIFCYLIKYGFSVANRVNSVYGKLVAIGCTTILFFHVFINIGMTVALMPVAGIPLLMISYGGSSLLLGMLCVALIVNIDINKNVI